MRALTVILLAALLSLWAYYAVEIAGEPTRLPVAVLEHDGDEEISAARLNNEGVELNSRGRRADALAYFEKAHGFRSNDPVIGENLRRQKSGLLKEAWQQALILSSVVTGFLLGGGAIFSAARGAAESRRLKRLRLRGDPFVTIRPGQEMVKVPLRFSEPVGKLAKRHPLIIVWSCARHGKHMKSRPPTKADGRRLDVELGAERLDRLRRYPGLWKGFLYLGKTPVGEAAARVI